MIVNSVSHKPISLLDNKWLCTNLMKLFWGVARCLLEQIVQPFVCIHVHVFSSLISRSIVFSLAPGINICMELHNMVLLEAILNSGNSVN